VAAAPLPRTWQRVRRRRGRRAAAAAGCGTTGGGGGVACGGSGAWRRRPCSRQRGHAGGRLDTAADVAPRGCRGAGRWWGARSAVPLPRLLPLPPPDEAVLHRRAVAAPPSAAAAPLGGACPLVGGSPHRGGTLTCHKSDVEASDRRRGAAGSLPAKLPATSCARDSCSGVRGGWGWVRAMAPQPWGGLWRPAPPPERFCACCTRAAHRGRPCRSPRRPPRRRPPDVTAATDRAGGHAAEAAVGDRPPLRRAATARSLGSGGIMCAAGGGARQW